MAILVILLGLMVFPTEEMAEFRKHSSGSGKYVWVETVECSSGMRRSGYSYAPSGSVFLKEVSEDGTLEMPVCDGDVK